MWGGFEFESYLVKRVIRSLGALMRRGESLDVQEAENVVYAVVRMVRNRDPVSK